MDKCGGGAEWSYGWEGVGGRDWSMCGVVGAKVSSDVEGLCWFGEDIPAMTTVIFVICSGLRGVHT